DLPAKTTVIRVTSLMRELINAIVVCPRLYIENGADGRLVSVLLDQLAVAQALPLHLSMPKSDVLLSVATRILEAPADLQPVEDLASSLGMSPRTLERRFKTEAGHSLRSFRRQAKLLRALELLSTDMSVSDISDTLGFGDPSAFIAMFRSALGVTPGRYLSEGLAPKKMSAVQNEQRKAGRRAEH
ncbi:helix-turn-helix transcriptional regulator, partial [Streptomyces albidoflavus]|uniref:helix-turn-helix transcriptional regulator n=1 Tax=Streptomyces albidoflavus TaxID=1886 RepID=UPI00343702B3